MAWVYILRGASGRHYIGSTTDLDRRIREHGRGHTASTKRLGGNVRLVASVETVLLPEARRLERRLKKMKNPTLAIEFLEQIGAQGLA